VPNVCQGVEQGAEFRGPSLRQAGDERFAISVNTQVLANGAAPTAHKNNQYIVCLLPGLLGLLDWCCRTAGTIFWSAGLSWSEV
jgi:hypothetical protein